MTKETKRYLIGILDLITAIGKLLFIVVMLVKTFTTGVTLDESFIFLLIILLISKD